MIKIILLKSGEDVIADIKEVLGKDNSDTLLAYQIENPYIVKLYEKEQMLLNEELSNQLEYNLLFTPWAPLSADKKFIIPLDWVVTIYEPHTDVINSYNEKMENLK